MIRIALVEDDKVYRQELVQYLHRYEEESGEKFNITVFTDGDEIVEDYACDFDIILMDIVMKYLNGMDAAERIREQDSEVVIIFITNTPQYAMKGYTVDALDYVLKPVSYFSFSQRIDRALARMKRRKKNYISISYKAGVKKLDVSRITYVEVRDHDLIFHTPEKEYLSKGSLTDMEQTLEQFHFFRCNKCYLVNLEYVEGVQNNDILVAGDLVQVSRARRKALLDALNNHINEVSK